LGHGYLFFGESAAARNGFVRSLLNFLENGSWELAGRPLLESLEISQENGSIGISRVREAVNFLSQRPVVASRRIVVIYDAENLTHEAQNALLKIVEEPPPYGMLLFSVRDPELLVPALVSRLARIYVAGSALFQASPKGAELAVKFLKGRGTERKNLIKSLIAGKDNEAVDDFVTALIAECRKDLPDRYVLLRELLRRNALMAAWNTNRKLQLETLISL
jgi:hypothetical protein